MGKENEEPARELVFADWSLTAELLAHAAPDAIVLHCLPAYRGKEIAAEVLDGPAERRVGRGREPAPRPEGGAGLPARRGRAARGGR